ncbi:MAG: YihA family ribosome biogenesis GTP-binding protein [Lachnospiraceae bacterium]|nr:YihA family ribosome biogenesis GTP-binding protein [Lachnospiraceae bacterium]
MKIKNVELETVCGPTSALPMNLLPELAFAGRSNVGKSSLINVLMQRKSLARVSGKPGKTQTINFYRVAVSAGTEALSDASFYLVDLPGYGYAKRSKEEIAKWGPMIERYMKRTAQMRALFLLVDARLPAQESDLQMLDFARHIGKRVVVIATKSDKLSKNELAKQKGVLQKGLALEEGEALVFFSATAKTGREEIYEIIEQILTE